VGRAVAGGRICPATRRQVGSRDQGEGVASGYARRVDRGTAISSAEDAAPEMEISCHATMSFIPRAPLAKHYVGARIQMLNTIGQPLLSVRP